MELLSHWPHWKNKNRGHFSVRRLPIEEGGEYVVESLHKTCFFTGFYCCKYQSFHIYHFLLHQSSRIVTLNKKSRARDFFPFLLFFIFFLVKSIGEFKFSPVNIKDTMVQESVQYQCPPFMGSFCRREVEYQRKTIMDNLKKHFEKH